MSQNLLNRNRDTSRHGTRTHRPQNTTEAGTNSGNGATGILFRILTKISGILLATTIIGVYFLEDKSYEQADQQLKLSLTTESREASALISNELQKKTAMVRKLHKETSKRFQLFDKPSNALFNWLSVMNRNAPDFADFWVYSQEGEPISMSSKAMFQYLRRKGQLLHKQDIKEIAAAVGRDSTLILGPFDSEIYGKILVFVSSFFDPLTGRVSGYFEGVYIWPRMTELFNNTKSQMFLLDKDGKIILDITNAQIQAATKPHDLFVSDGAKIRSENNEHLGWQVRASAPHTEHSFWPLSEGSQILVLCMALVLASIVGVVIWDLRTIRRMSRVLSSGNSLGLSRILKDPRAPLEAQIISQKIIEFSAKVKHGEHRLMQQQSLLETCQQIFGDLFVICDEDDQIVLGSETAQQLFADATYYRSDMVSPFPPELNPIFNCKVNTGLVGVEVYMSNATMDYSGHIWLAAGAYHQMGSEQTLKLVFAIDINERRRALDNERNIMKVVADREAGPEPSHAKTS